MFRSDNPINNKSEDCLKRTEFSKQLAKAILSYTKIDNFTISLCGKWGAGKTSILNMVIEEIDELSVDKKFDEKPIIITFNPWNYSDCNQLINQFFQAIQSKIKVDDKNEKLKNVGNALQKYSSIFEYSTYIPLVGQYLGPIKDLLTNVGEHMFEKAEERDSLAFQKTKVIDALKAQKQKFIIIIDDIDRLNNEQIRLIFQLVNSLAGFPNMIYLLSFDRNVVARALESEQNCNGEEYLEKIIQVPFEVPTANKSLINNAFCEMLSDIIFDEKALTDNFEKDYWDFVFHKCISPFVKSMRDVNRILNTFQFKYGLMQKETNCIDLLALTTIQVSAPEIYYWIFDKANYLTGSKYSYGSISSVEQKNNYKKYYDDFKNIYKDPSLMLTVIQTLFPRFSWSTGGYHPSSDSDDELRYKQKIASKDRIKRYFNLSLEEISITKEKMTDTIKNFDALQLQEHFNVLMKSGELNEYLNEFQSYIPEIPLDRCLLFINELLKLVTMESNHKNDNNFAISHAQKCYNSICEILRKQSVDANNDILKALIESADEKSLPFVCNIVESIENAYGKMGNSIDYDNRFLQEDSLECIETMLLSKIKNVYCENCFLNFIWNESIYRVLNHFKKEYLDEYMKNILKEAVNVPKYLNLCVHSWSSGKSHGWYFSESDFLEYITKEDAYKKIHSLKNTTEFSSLQWHFKEIAVAFDVWYNGNNEDYHNISSEKIHSIIPEWEATSV